MSIKDVGRGLELTKKKTLSVMKSMRVLTVMETMRVLTVMKSMRVLTANIALSWDKRSENNRYPSITKIDIWQYE